MIVLDILMFVVFAVTVALTVLMLIKFPEKAKTISLLQSPDEREDEGYRAQKYNRLKARFEYSALLSALITFACFYFDKFPNNIKESPSWLFWISIVVFLTIFVGFWIFFSTTQVKNNIAFYHEGYKVRFQKLDKFLNRENRRAAMMCALCYSLVFYSNAITLWFMIA